MINDKGSGEWGIGSRVLVSKHSLVLTRLDYEPKPHSPLPTPHSPFIIYHLLVIIYIWIL